jgi:hypothetical protein
MRDDNPYKGINAHLNSKLQNEGLWTDFHNTYIVTLRRLLKEQLLPMGYTAQIEQSLQVRRLGEDISVFRPDIDIIDRFATRREPTALLPSERTLSIVELLEFDPSQDYYPAIVIQKQGGESVTWVEILSPTNKLPNRGHYESYRQKRFDAIQAGIGFIEIDFLHQQPPTLAKVRNYANHEASSHPYRIVVLQPTPNFKEGMGLISEFDVDMILPTLEIPLLGGDILKHDFDVSYQATFSQGLYGSEMDYSQLPTAFGTYSVADQERIRQVMARIND